MKKLFIVFKDKSKVTYTFKSKSQADPIEYFKRHAKSSMKSAILQQYPIKDNHPIDLLKQESEEQS